MSQHISFKSFLSHKYEATDVNLYFFKIFKDVAEVQFEVDDGKLSTNVTRLEKMVREADTFIGIYPFTGSPTPEELKNQSKYFRLEMDLAIRSQKPAIIFYDHRYVNLLRPPSNVFSYSFDFNEITGSGGFPNYNKHKRAFESFCEILERKRQYEEIIMPEERTVTALFTSRSNDGKTLFDSDSIGAIETLLANHNYSELEVIEWPFTINNKLLHLLETIDFAIVELSGTAGAGGLPAFLHGRFIPMIRLKHVDESAPPNKLPVENFLFGGVEVGYGKDTLQWSSNESLISGLSKKLETINWSKRRFNTYEEAQKYFISASLRKEAVFVSYSAKDYDLAKDIINSLKRHYQTVFDYRDGKSIVPGQPWIAEIFDKLSSSAIGINLLSQSYFQSGNCMHEAQEMAAKKDEGKLKLFPIKLHVEQIDLPPFLQSIQYVRRTDYPTVDELVNEIVKVSTP